MEAIDHVTSVTFKDYAIMTSFKIVHGTVIHQLYRKRKESSGKLGANSMKRVDADAHFLTPWLFDSAKRPDVRADYCLDCSFHPQYKHQVLVFTAEWTGFTSNCTDGTVIHQLYRLYSYPPIVQGVELPTNCANVVSHHI